MGLLNYLFRDKKSIAQDLAITNTRRMELWQEHLENYSRRREIVWTIHNKIYDPSKKIITTPPFVKIRYNESDFVEYAPLLAELESLISPDIINLNEEVKSEKEIIDDVKDLTEMLKDIHENELGSLMKKLASGRIKQQGLLQVFKKIYDLLQVELQLIKMIQKNPPKDIENFNYLHTLIEEEGKLYSPFKKGSYFTDTTINEDIQRFTRAILLNEKIKEKVETAEEKFARKLARDFNPDNDSDSLSSYGILAEKIYSSLVKLAKKELAKDAAIEYVVMKVEDLMNNDAIMMDILKRLRPSFDDVKDRIVTTVFRNAFESGHFEDFVRNTR